MLQAWDRQEASSRVKKLFLKNFEAEADGVWFAPGRVNLIGEHTDYNGGLCLPIALPHGTYVAASKREDGLMRLVSAQIPGVLQVDLQQVLPGNPNKIPGWATYVAGVVWALRQQGFILGGADIAIDSCVPFGAGLSSSAALECAVAVAMVDLYSLAISKEQIVEAARAAENQIAGAPTGGLDQSASVRCARGHALELNCRDMSATNVPFDLAKAQAQLLVIDTRATHEQTDGQYGKRRTSCERAAQILGVSYLADIPPEGLAGALERLEDPMLRRCTRHVVSEVARVRHSVQLLREEQLDASTLERIGSLFNESHASLRDDYEVSCEELDVAVEAALAAGAYGARMTGGGFGGSAIALVDSEQSEPVRAQIIDAYAAHSFTEPVFLEVEPGPAAGRIC